jgi:hypothetical protein
MVADPSETRPLVGWSFVERPLLDHLAVELQSGELDACLLQ